MDFVFYAAVVFGLVYLCLVRVDRPAAEQPQFDAEPGRMLAKQAWARVQQLRPTPQPQRTGTLYVHLGSST